MNGAHVCGSRMEDPVTESVKAAQEMAKAASEGLKATQKFGAYTAKLIKEPAGTVIGILEDRLKFIRWERQLRFADKLEEIVRERNLEGKITPIPPKFALPIIENATLEEEDFLQDMWAKLMVEAGAPQSKKRVRTAFIEIIKQLEVVDAKLLEAFYQEALSELEKTRKAHKESAFTPVDMPLSTIRIARSKRIQYEEYMPAIDNLFRLRCLRPFVEEDSIEVPSSDGYSDFHDVTTDHQYSKVSITSLGFDFVEICM